MATYAPNGCRHDGIDQRTHARQWTPDAGWHTWEQPTQEQIRDRMCARRSDPVCEWNPATASPACDHDPTCPVHGQNSQK